jgi:predicted aconitase
LKGQRIQPSPRLEASRILYLTKEEEKILDGEQGEAPATAMKLLVAVGDVFGATKLISVESAQISGISYKTIGDAGLEFVESFAKSEAKASIYTTMNPAGMDLENWREMGIPEEFAVKQSRIVSALKEIGVSPTCTCTPYLLTRRPACGDHLAWAESSAVIYANSILGARTNREGGPMALASAIIGKTPLYGLHVNENRVPTVEVTVSSELRSELDFSLLGFFIGGRMPRDVPMINLPRSPVDNTSLKALGAGMATSGGQALYHIGGLTPEWNILGKDTLRERVSVDRFDLDRTKESLSKESRPEHICIGCPHCSIEEIKRISQLSKDRRFAKRLLVFTSRYVWNLAKARAYLERIAEAGGKVIRDTCMVVAPLEDLGVTRVLTNSTKAAHYLPSLCDASVGLRSLDECLEYATHGD